MEGDVLRRTEDGTRVSEEVPRPPPKFYPIANDLELLVLSVFGSLPEWVIPLHQASSSQPGVSESDRAPNQDPEISKVEIARQQRELVSDLKSRFGGDQGNPVMFELLHSLEIPHPKKLMNPVNNEPGKTPRKQALSPPTQGSQTTRSKRTRPDSIKESNKQMKSQKPSSSPLKDGGVKPEKLRSSKKVDKKELSARESHPWDAICREEASFSSQFCITSVAEALLISRIGRECIVPSPILPCPVFPSPPVQGPDAQDEEEIGAVLKSFPGIIRNTKLFNLATNGASSLDPTWANKIDFRWTLCDEELMNGDCQIQSCRFQHKKEYLLHGPELESHRNSRGSIDNCLNAGIFDVSFLRWSQTESTQISHPIKDDLPVYERSTKLECPETRSSLFRLISFDQKELRLQSIQPELSCGCPYPLSFTFEGPAGASDVIFQGKEPQTVDEILVHVLRMIDWGTGESSNSLPCLQKALKFLSNQLERFPMATHLFQLYLMLLIRDPGIELDTKLNQFECYFEKHGPWYRGILMVAGLHTNIKDKIRIYENGICALLKSSESSITSLETCRCTVDLFLRIMFLELKQDPQSFTQKHTFSFGLRHLNKKGNESDTQNQSTPPMTLIERFYDGLRHYPSERFLFGTCVLHGYLYKHLPIEIVNSFGFPKQFRVLNWTIVMRAIPNLSLLEIRDFVFALMTTDATGSTFFTLSAPMETKQVFATNVLLLLEAAGLTKPVYCMKLFLQGDDPSVVGESQDSEFTFLDVAEALDEQLDKQYPLNGASHNGSGFIVEQLMNHMFHHGRKNEVQSWFRSKEYKFEEPKGYRRVLASMKLSLFFNTVSQALKVLKLIEDHTEEALEKTSRTEQGLYYLAQMYNCILNKTSDPEPIQGYLKKALKSAQGLPQLKKTVWSEAVLLSVLALPTEDPRKDQQKVQNKSGLSFSVVGKYLREREGAFEILMSLIKQYCDEAVPVLRGLDNIQERLTSNPRVRRVLNPTSTFEICPLLDSIRVVLPHLMQSEVLKMVEFLITKFGNCPSLAEFLIQIGVYLPDYDRSFLKSLIQVAMHSTPCARIEVWKQMIKIATQYGRYLSEELESHAKRLYPGWQD